MLIHIYERVTKKINDLCNDLIDYPLEKEYRKHIFTILTDVIPRVGEDIRMHDKDWTVTNVTYYYYDKFCLEKSIILTVKERNKEKLVKYEDYCSNESNISILDLETIEGE